MRILLTGGSGLLGTELKKLDPGILAPSHDELDICDAERVREHIAETDPDLVIHAAAETDNRRIEADPAASLETNVIGTANIAKACLGRRTRLVYLSTDYVYRGDRGNYSETDEVLPANLYAWTKLAGEAAVRAVPNHLIIRTSFGSAKFDYPAAFTDKWASKEYVDLIAPQIYDAATGALTGVVNIGGPRRTLFDYARARNPDVAEMRLVDAPTAIPADTSLDLSRWETYRAGEGVVRAVRKCRVCDGESLVRYLDLGMMPLANNLAPTAGEARAMQRFPMQVQFCETCALSQLTVVVDPREMFSHYTYRSSVNKGYLRHCRQMARSVGDRFTLGAGDLVVDIAGNDGSLLAEFREELGVHVLNVDPARNIAAIAESRGVPTVVDFWSSGVAARIVEEHRRPRLITATNVFAHVDDVKGFVSAAGECLDETGVLLLEFPYCVDFIEHREFDTIYFEHLSYVLIEPVRRLAAQFGMQVFDVQKQDIHGGTVRVFLGREGVHDIEDSVASFVAEEKSRGFHGAVRYLDWRREIDGMIDELRAEIGALRRGGARIAAFAASAKGNTLLNACGLDAATIEYIVDDTPEKIGRFSPGNGIPIVDRTALAADPPDYLLMLAWNFAAEIIDNMSGFDGQYIIPVPSFRVVRSSSELA